MLELAGHIAGETESDLVVALDEVKRLLEEGFTSGASSNDSGSYKFEIKEI